VPAAPGGDLAVEQELYDADRVRGQEATQLGRGHRSYSTAARHDATARIVARTELSFEANDDSHARQWVTIVEPAGIPTVGAGYVTTTRRGGVLREVLGEGYASLEPVGSHQQHGG
jgi:hypothetical protein